MANENHTPGKWEVPEDNKCLIVCDGIPVADASFLAYNNFKRSAKEAIANARLIAAAPAMYEALKSAKEMIDNMCDEYLRFVGADSKAFDNIEFMAIEAALAAANPEK